MSLGALIKEKRLQLGLSLEEAAQAAGTSKGHLHALEGASRKGSV